jgi:hypothetical protein
MDPLIPDQWLLFRVRFAAVTGDEVAFRMEVEGPQGAFARRRVSLPFQVAGMLASQLVAGRIDISGTQLGEFVVDSLGDAVEGFGFQRTRFGERVPFPVFISPVQSVAELPWEEMIGQLSHRIETPIEVMRMTSREVTRRRTLTLPVRVGVVTDTYLPIEAVVRGAEARMRYLAEPEVREHGWRMLYHPDWPWWRWPEQESPQIVICDDAVFDHFDFSWFRPARGDHPVLFITLGRERRGFRALPLAPGFAQLHFPMLGVEKNAEMLADFLEGIIHDFPLHEACHHTIRRHFTEQAPNVPDAMRPFLIADPGSNQSLRLSDALETLEHEAFTLRQQTTQGESSAFIERLGPEAPRALAQGLRALADLGAPAREALDTARRAEIDLRWEGRGLVPMSRAAAQVQFARRQQREMMERTANLLARSDVREALKENLERHVDAALMRPDSAGVFKAVPPNEPLAERARYRLRVHIGRREDGSLMVGAAPPLDPLLPSLSRDEEHEIQVIVFGKDFLLHSPAARTVRLPRFGGTAPVHFDVETPAFRPDAQEHEEGKPMRSGEASGSVTEPRAELRFGIYFRNRLLQSFLLHASLGKAMPSEGAPAVGITCDFTQSARFSNLDELKPRLLSLAVNRDSSASHTLMLAREGQATSVRWTEVALSKWAGQVRDVLETATRDAHAGARFSFTEDLRVADPNSQDFDDTVRLLATAGGDLCDQLYLSHDQAEEFLAAVRTSPPDTIETVRHDLTYAFPWGLLYDFTRPEPGTPEYLLPVCRGVDADGVSPCRCAETQPELPTRFCIRGFWGVRHRVEQLVWPGGEPRDAPELIGPPRPATTVGFLRPVSDDYVEALATHLNGSPQGFWMEYPHGAGWLSLLHPGEKRPAIIAVVSHLEDVASASGIRLPRMQLDGTGAWLENPHFVAEIKAKRSWKKPQQPLVLLMACSGGFTRLETATTFAGNFLRLGAAGTVASDCTVFTGLAARFARDLIEALAADLPMGEAMRRCTEELAREGCPLGFVFTYLGSADLQLAR